MKLSSACLISFASVFLFSSCLEEVNLNTEDEYEICLNYIMSNEEVQTLHLCWTKGNSDSEYTPITEAEVNLYLKKGNDYNTYLVSNLEYREEYFNDKQSGNFTVIFKQHTPYTNIVNGRGIFGATYKLVTEGFWGNAF